MRLPWASLHGGELNSNHRLGLSPSELLLLEPDSSSLLLLLLLDSLPLSLLLSLSLLSSPELLLLLLLLFLWGRLSAILGLVGFSTRDFS